MCEYVCTCPECTQKIGAFPTTTTYAFGIIWASGWGTTWDNHTYYINIAFLRELCKYNIQWLTTRDHSGSITATKSLGGLSTGWRTMLRWNTLPQPWMDCCEGCGFYAFTCGKGTCTFLLSIEVRKQMHLPEHSYPILGVGKFLHPLKSSLKSQVNNLRISQDRRCRHTTKRGNVQDVKQPADCGAIHGPPVVGCYGATIHGRILTIIGLKSNLKNSQQPPYTDSRRINDP